MGINHILVTSESLFRSLVVERCLPNSRSIVFQHCMRSLYTLDTLNDASGPVRHATTQLVHAYNWN